MAFLDVLRAVWAAGRPVTLVEAVILAALPLANVSLISEKFQSFASAMEPASADARMQTLLSARR